MPDIYLEHLSIKYQPPNDETHSSRVWNQKLPGFGDSNLFWPMKEGNNLIIYIMLRVLYYYTSVLDIIIYSVLNYSILKNKLKSYSSKRIPNFVCHGFYFLAVKIQRKLNSLSIGVINRGISNQMGSFPGEVTLARGKEIAI